MIEPFGMGIGKPTFAVKRVRLKRARWTKTGAHVILTFAGESGGSKMRAIIFGVSGKAELINSIKDNRDSLLDIAGKISVTKYGETFIMEDARLSV
jgi:single-stranded DNA-specific DHH superfamily exonuclease